MLDRIPGYTTYFVLRGTYLPDSQRCTVSNVDRPPSFLDYDEHGGSDRSLMLECYTDLRVNAYILGKGPPTLTVKTIFYDSGALAEPAAEDAQAQREYTAELLQQFSLLAEAFAGREAISFIGAPSSTSVEVWQLTGYWDVRRQEDGVVVAVHPGRDLWRRYRPDEYQTFRAKFYLELPVFIQAVTEAHEARVNEYSGRIGPDDSMPMLIIDANQLRDAMHDIGAYDHPDGPPVQPPPAPVAR